MGGDKHNIDRLGKKTTTCVVSWFLTEITDHCQLGQVNSQSTQVFEISIFAKYDSKNLESFKNYLVKSKIGFNTISRFSYNLIVEKLSDSNRNRHSVRRLKNIAKAGRGANLGFYSFQLCAISNAFDHSATAVPLRRH